MQTRTTNVENEDEDEDETILLLPNKRYPKGMSKSQEWAVRHRWGLMCFALFQSFCVSGVIYGWPSLVLLLRDEGLYACDGKEESFSSSSSSSSCADQEILLNQVFSTGTSGLLVTNFVMGMVLDKFGPKVTVTVGFLCHFVGVLLFALSKDSDGGLDGYLIGYGLMGFGGPAVHVGSMHMSNLFPQNRGTVVSSFNGVFSLSGYTFLIFYGIYTASGGVINRRTLFLAYAVLVALLLLISPFLWPLQAYQYFPPQDEETCGTALKEVDTKEASREDQVTDITRKRMFGKSFWEQLLSPQWAWPTLFMIVQIFGLQYYIGSVRDQLYQMGDTTSTYTIIANVMTPLGALGAPLYGWVMDTKGFAMSYFVVNLLGIAVNMLALVPVVPLQIATFALWAVHRTFSFSATNAYVPRMFGDKHYGKLNGLTFLSCGLINQCSVLVTAAVVNLWEGSFFYPNLAFVIARVPLFLVCWYLLRLAI